VLQNRLLNLAHASHMGIFKTKSRLRKSYWWIKMDDDIERFISACHCCKQVVRDSPVQVTDWSVQPWFKLHIDIAGPKYDSDSKRFYIIALIDDHSKFVVHKILSSIESKRVICFLEEIFTTFGLCSKLVTDNGV